MFEYLRVESEKSSEKLCTSLKHADSELVEKLAYIAVDERL